ncbi:unnamed protein product [Mucor hiemalis]
MLHGGESRFHLTSFLFVLNDSLNEIRQRHEVFIIDATYKTNNLKMPLVSIQGVSHLGGDKLLTTPIAYALVSNEQKDTYIWLLQSLKAMMALPIHLLLCL